MFPLVIIVILQTRDQPRSALATPGERSSHNGATRAFTTHNTPPSGGAARGPNPRHKMLLCSLKFFTFQMSEFLRSVTQPPHKHTPHESNTSEHATPNTRIYVTHTHTHTDTHTHTHTQGWAPMIMTCFTQNICLGNPLPPDRNLGTAPSTRQGNYTYRSHFNPITSFSKTSVVARDENVKKCFGSSDPEDMVVKNVVLNSKYKYGTTRNGEV